MYCRLCVCSVCCVCVCARVCVCCLLSAVEGVVCCVGL
jgi:hypothetical protein